jgi:hypothetical protein
LIEARSKSKDTQFISELSEDHNHAFKKRKKKRYNTNIILPESSPVTKHSSDHDDNCPTLNTSLGTIILRIVIK